MLAAAIHRGAEVGLWGTCMDARAIREEQLLEGARRSNLQELTDWTVPAATPAQGIWMTSWLPFRIGVIPCPLPIFEGGLRWQV